MQAATASQKREAKPRKGLCVHAGGEVLFPRQVRLCSLIRIRRDDTSMRGGSIGNFQCQMRG